MATHAQIDKNVNDTLSSWDQIRNLIHAILPYYSKHMSDDLTRISRAKRRW